ncbi:MAG: outer membrane protein assembly factor BamE [Planctomycetes bacterium]|nr:outer membrane protein assembly factor BamE [Planctomycetota bacterium]
MMLFANGVEGSATGSAGCCLFVAWGIVFFFSALLFKSSRQFVGKDKPAAKQARVALLVVSGLIPLSCCVLPPVAIRILYGNFPVGGVFHKVHEGMTKDEVLATLGPPHSRYEDVDRPRWYYWSDSYGLNYESVWFGPDGSVESISGN